MLEHRILWHIASNRLADMSQSAEDVDFGVWKQIVSLFLHGGDSLAPSVENQVGKIELASSDNATFQTNTDILAQMNSSMNANTYVSKVATIENNRVTMLDAKAKRDIYRLREQSLSITFGEQFYTFLAIGVRVAIVASMLVFYVLVLTARKIITQRSGIFMGVSIMVITGGVIMAMSLSAASRRNDNWGHYYWKSQYADGSSS